MSCSPSPTDRSRPGSTEVPPAHEAHRQRIERWVQQHGPRVWGYLWASVRHRQWAEDLWQEVFRRAWQAADRYQEQGQARAYLLRIADRLLCDHARRRHREITVDETQWKQIEPPDGDRSAALTLWQQEANEQLAAALKRLSPDQRRALLLRYYGDLSFQEIADQLGCPLNTALSHVHRGLAALRERFAACP